MVIRLVDGSVLALASVRPYTRRVHGRVQHVSGYHSRAERALLNGWIPNPKWAEGQERWALRGEAIWKANEWKPRAGRLAVRQDARAGRPGPGELPEPAPGRTDVRRPAAGRAAEPGPGETGTTGLKDVIGRLRAELPADPAGWTRPPAADGGPDEQVMQYNEVIRQAGRALSAELTQRTLKASSDAQAKLDAIDRQLEDLGAQSFSAYTASLTAVKHEMDAQAVRAGFKSLADLKDQIAAAVESAGASAPEGDAPLSTLELLQMIRGLPKGSRGDALRADTGQHRAEYRQVLQARGLLDNAPRGKNAEVDRLLDVLGQVAASSAKAGAADRVRQEKIDKQAASLRDQRHALAETVGDVERREAIQLLAEVRGDEFGGTGLDYRGETTGKQQDSLALEIGNLAKGMLGRGRSTVDPGWDPDAEADALVRAARAAWDGNMDQAVAELAVAEREARKDTFNGEGELRAKSYEGLDGRAAKLSGVSRDERAPLDKNAAASLRWAEAGYPQQWLADVREHAPGGYEVDYPVPRGYYNDDLRVIALSADSAEHAGGTSGRVATHELAHAMEVAVPGLLQAEQAEIWRRTSTGPVGSRKIEKPTLLNGYSAEYARKDNFPIPYTGRDYSGGRGVPLTSSYELFSTGAESLLAGSPYMDNEFQEWMLGSMAMLGTGDDVAAPHGPSAVASESLPSDSLAKYTRPDGSLDPERAALHERIIEGMLAGHKSQAHPVATYYGGGPASGKSALRPAGDDSVVIDSDEVKKQLPEYQAMLAAGDSRAAAFVHEESSQISKAAMARAAQRHINFVLDGTGDSSVTKMTAKIGVARKAGYEVAGRYVTVDSDVAVARAAKRAQRTGRMVPESVIRETHQSVSRTLPQLLDAKAFDTVEVYDNNGASPRLILRQDKGRAPQVLDAAAWQAFKDKAEESPVPAAVTAEKSAGPSSAMTARINAILPMVTSQTSRNHLVLAMRAAEAGDTATAAKELRAAHRSAGSDAARRSIEEAQAELGRPAADAGAPVPGGFASQVAARDFMKKAAVVMPSVFPGTALDWDGKAPTVYPDEDHPEFLAYVDWDEHVNLNASTADGIRDALAGNGPVESPAAFSVVLHELDHVAIPPGENRVTNGDMDAYQQRANQAIEEGFTELATVHHAAEFFDKLGIGDRPTLIASPSVNGAPQLDPQWEKKARAHVKALRALAAAVRKHGSQPYEQAARHLESDAEDLAQVPEDIMRYAVDPGRGLAEVQHLGDSGFAKRSLALQREGRELAVAPAYRHQTMSEYARTLDTPQRIADGMAWGHYGGWTAAAQAWTQQVAGGDDAKARQLADEVNAAGVAEKVRVMARQAMTATGLTREKMGDAAYGSVQEAVSQRILSDWSGSDAASGTATAQNAARAAQDAAEHAGYREWKVQWGDLTPAQQAAANADWAENVESLPLHEDQQAAALEWKKRWLGGSAPGVTEGQAHAAEAGTGSRMVVQRRLTGNTEGKARKAERGTGRLVVAGRRA